MFLVSPAISKAGFDPSFLQTHSVRVFVKKEGEQKGLVSSGFLWKTDDQIVASLHAVPSKNGITVECDGEKKKARVVKTLAHADLVLLRLEKPGWIYPHKCRPLTSFKRAKPAPGTDLWTWGYHSGATSGTSRTLLKQGASNETLKGLLHYEIAAQLKALGVPSIDLKVYYVQGGSAPGYSGAPVVDESKRLIGIIDGGLDKGASDYNWLIPAKYLDELLASTTDEIPTTLAAGAGHLFSSGIAEPVADPMIKYDAHGKGYEWVLMKEARSLSDIAATAIEAEGVDKLLTLFSPAQGLLAAEEIEFDIYKEMSRDFVIAVPAGQALEIDSRDLVSRLSERDKRSKADMSGIIFSEDIGHVKNSKGEKIQASHPDFFQNIISSTLEQCTWFGTLACLLDRESMNVVDFGQGNKILRFGMTANLSGREGQLGYYYFSLAVRGNAAFSATAQIHSLSEPELFECLANNIQDSGRTSTCQNSKAIRTQLSQLIAAHLTTFSGLLTDNGNQVVLSKFIYEEALDDTAPTFVSYSDGRKLRFIDLGDQKWHFYVAGRVEIAEEVRREDSPRGPLAVVRHKNSEYLIPINGGPYYKSTGGEGWSAVSLITAKTEYAHLPYYEGSNLRFVYSGDNNWRVYTNDNFENFIETKRFTEAGSNIEYAEINANDTTYLVPLAGGETYKLISEGQRIRNGSIEVGEIIKGPMR